MRIALVANSTWNIYNFRLNIIDKFLEMGHSVFVIAPIDEYITYREKYPTVTHLGLRTLDRDGKNPLRDCLLILELARKYKKLQLDLVIHYTNKPNIYGGFAARIAKVKSIAVVTGLGYAFLHSGLVQKITKKLYQLSSRYHSKVIFENTSDLKYFSKLGLVNKKKARSVKGCGVDLEFYKPSSTFSPNGIIVFSFIGRLLYDKGVHEFIEAARTVKSRYPATSFWIVGELDSENPSTINKEELNQWIASNVIEYHGFQQDIRPFIGKSNCVVLPSYREGLPRTILEGMAMGKAVITTKTAGCEETVDEGKNGYLVNVKDVDDLVAAIERFLNLSDSKRLELGKNGRAKAEQEFGSKFVANSLYDIIVE